MRPFVTCESVFQQPAKGKSLHNSQDYLVCGEGKDITEKLSCNRL
jgi:hypothetical protein